MVRRLAILVLTLTLLLPRGVGAQPQSHGTTTFTKAQIAALLKAVVDADKSPKITIDVSGKSAQDMPAYDPIVHYAGLDPATQHPQIWLLTNGPRSEEAVTAFNSAMMLAVMDSGFAGAAWKAYYDRLAAEDAALPPGSKNPYLNRLMFTVQIHCLIATGLASTTCPSPAPSV